MKNDRLTNAGRAVPVQAMTEEDIAWSDFMRMMDNWIDANAARPASQGAEAATVLGDEIDWEHASDDWHPALRADTTGLNFDVQIKPRDVTKAIAGMSLALAAPLTLGIGALLARLLTKATATS